MAATAKLVFVAAACALLVTGCVHSETPGVSKPEAPNTQVQKAEAKKPAPPKVACATDLDCARQGDQLWEAGKKKQGLAILKKYCFEKNLYQACMWFQTRSEKGYEAASAAHEAKLAKSWDPFGAQMKELESVRTELLALVDADIPKAEAIAASARAIADDIRALPGQREKARFDHMGKFPGFWAANTTRSMLEGKLYDLDGQYGIGLTAEVVRERLLQFRATLGNAAPTTCFDDKAKQLRGDPACGAVVASCPTVFSSQESALALYTVDTDLEVSARTLLHFADYRPDELNEPNEKGLALAHQYQFHFCTLAVMAGRQFYSSIFESLPPSPFAGLATARSLVTFGTDCSRDLERSAKIARIKELATQYPREPAFAAWQNDVDLYHANCQRLAVSFCTRTQPRNGKLYLTYEGQDCKWHDVSTDDIRDSHLLSPNAPQTYQRSEPLETVAACHAAAVAGLRWTYTPATPSERCSKAADKLAH